MDLQVPIAIDRHIGLAISSRRREVGLPLTEFANLLQIDIISVKRFEKGVERPTSESLLAIADVLKVKISYLFSSAFQFGIDLKTK